MATAKELLVKFCTNVVFPAMDDAVTQLQVPYQLDDKLWAFVKEKISDLLDVAVVDVDSWGVSINGVGAFDLKDALKAFIVNDVFPTIDEVTSNWHTPFEVDDIVWTLLKTKIGEAIDGLDFQIG